MYILDRIVAHTDRYTLQYQVCELQYDLPMQYKVVSVDHVDRLTKIASP